MLYKYAARIRQNGIQANVVFDVPDDAFDYDKRGAERHDVLVRLHAGKIFGSMPDIDEPHLHYVTGKPLQDMMNVRNGTIRAIVLRYDGGTYTIEIPPAQHIRNASLDDLVKQLGLTDVKRIELRADSIPLDEYETEPDVRNGDPVRIEICPGKGPDFIVEFRPGEISVEDGGVAYWAENVLPCLGEAKDWHVLKRK